MSSFSFIALGDMPYRKKDISFFNTLITEINARNPKFVVHLGDTKSGRGTFNKGFYKERQELFSAIEAPFIYTPGDNDWVDGKADHKSLATPAARLKKLRAAFFNHAEDDVDRKLWIIRQDSFLENAWWTLNDVLFVTLHTVGNNNNRRNDEQEFKRRNAANMDWIHRSIGDAPHRAVVILTHANLWHPTKKGAIQSGFAETVDKIGSVAQSSNLPVLVVHGDKHELVMDHPAARPSNNLRLTNLTRVQVMGDKDLRAIEVTVQYSNAVRFDVCPFGP